MQSRRVFVGSMAGYWFGVVSTPPIFAADRGEAHRGRLGWYPEDNRYYITIGDYGTRTPPTRYQLIVRGEDHAATLRRRMRGAAGPVILTIYGIPYTDRLSGTRYLLVNDVE